MRAHIPLFSSFVSLAAAIPFVRRHHFHHRLLELARLPRSIDKAEWAKTKVSASTLEAWAAVGSIPEASSGAWRPAAGDEQPRRVESTFVESQLESSS